MRRKPLLISVFPALALLGIVACNVSRYEEISDNETPLSVDYYEENFEQLEAPRVLDEIIIKFVDPADVPGKEKQLEHEIEKVQKVGFVEALGVYVVRVEDLEKNPNAVLNRFKNNRFIEYIEPNYTLDYSYTPNDPNYKFQSFNLNIINAPAGWDITTGKNAGMVNVAIIDSGVAAHNDMPVPRSGYSAVSEL